MTDKKKLLPPVYVAGLGLCRVEDPSQYPPAVLGLLEKADVIIAGKGVLSALSGHPAEKLAVDADLPSLYTNIRRNRAAGLTQVVLCSGDPLFYGLGARLAEQFSGPSGQSGGDPAAQDPVRVIPAPCTLQAAAAFLGMPWEKVRAVSLHGRADWLPLAHALIAGGPVFVLTDERSSPAALAAWMSERGRWRYTMHVFDTLYQTPEGEVRAEAHARLGLAQAASWQPARQRGPQVVMLEPESSLLPSAAAQPWPFGLKDADVVKENRLLTKAPIRAAALAALGIEQQHIVWDLGAGSGAVSVEAARLAWQGGVYAVEKNADRVDMLRANRKRYGVANLEIVHGEMPDCLPDRGPYENALPAPDRIFVGGGLGGASDKAEETLIRAWRALKPGGVLLADCVLLSSLERARSILEDLGASMGITCLQASTSSTLAGDLRLEAFNPVFLVRAAK